MRRIRAFLVDFSGVWQTMAIFASIFGVNFDLGPWKIPVVLALGVLLLLGTGKTVRQVKVARAKQAIDDMVDANQGTLKSINIKAVKIPDQRTVESAYFLLKEKAKAWSDDVVIGEFSAMQLYYAGSKPSESFDLEYHSSWKGLTCNAALTSYSTKGEISEEFKERNGFLVKNVEKPFFMAFPNWRHAMQVALQSVSDSLEGVDQFSITIDDHVYATKADGPAAGIYIRYKKDKIETSKLFVFDGKTLVDRKSNKKIDIK